MTTEKPAHSPLGASGAERWMNCPGSNVLVKTLNLPPSDESDFAAEGTAAHEAAAHCITQRLDTWEIVGEKFHGIEITSEMAEHIQVYVDYANSLRAGNKSSWWCEFHISDDLHPLFYGTVDFGNLFEQVLEIVDFKFGAGILVEPERNPQLMYYAYGLLQHQPGARRVKLTIVQPRAWHPDGLFVRSWECDADFISEWGEKTLLPAMQAAEVDETLDAGSWCRFCPAKLACPLLYGLFKAAANINPKVIVNLSDEAAGRDYKLREAVKFYLKAQEDDMLKRLLAGRAIAEAKLVNKKADRVLKDGAEAVFKEAFGDEAYTAPELKSPAKLEALGPKAKLLVKEYAYMPQTGYTVALADDRRQAVRLQTTTQVFGDAIAKLEAAE